MPVVEARSSAIHRNATVILAVIACGACLYYLSAILTPLALALFLAVMIDGFARVLEHRLKWLSQRWAVPVAILLSLLLFGGTCFFIAENAASFGSQLAAYAPKLNTLIAYVAGLFGLQAPPSVSQIVHQLEPTKYLGSVARAFQNFTVTAGLVLIYTAFILVSRRGWAHKVVGLFPNHTERHEAVATFQRIRSGVEQYLWVQTVTGLMIAGSSWLAMVAVGLDNALFWAFLIFIASYIPVIGGIIAVAAPPIFALVQFSTFWQAIVLFAVLQTITLVVGNVIYPRMQGRSLNIDPLIVLLSLAAWGAVWGLAGAFLSTPLTVAIMVILAQFEGTRWIAVILSADGDPQQLKSKKASQAPDASLASGRS